MAATAAPRAERFYAWLRRHPVSAPLGVLGLLLGVTCVGNAISPPIVYSACDRADGLAAFLASQHFVERRLVAPRTARIPSERDPAVEAHKVQGCVFSVTAYVEAQNAYGVPLRTPYSAFLQADDETDGWRLIILEMD